MEQVAGNYTFRIKMNDDGFEEPLSYSLEKYSWRFPAEPTEAVQETAQQEEVYEVEAITDKRLDEGGQLLYKVKWKGYPEEESTWEPLEHLESAKNLVGEFNKAYEEKKKKKAARKRQRKTEQPPSRKRAKIEPGLKAQQYTGGPTFWPNFPIQSTLDINDCHNWNEEDISQWLDVFDFGGMYRQNFLDNAVDGRLLLEITFPTLFEELQIMDEGHKHQLKTAITVLKQARQIKYGDEN